MEQKGLNSIPSPYAPQEYTGQNIQKNQGNSFLPGFLRNLKQDDIILIIIIVLLLTDSGSSSTDKILIGVLVFIFFAGLEGNIFGLI